MRYIKALKIVFFIFLIYFVLFFASTVSAGPYEYQQCDLGTTCTIGEFLYDDSYVPIATATCNFTSRYPDGSLFVNSQEMTVASDGWYSYTIEATGAAGLYRSQICCTTLQGEYLCLDKSFKVATPSSTLTKGDVADSVWNAQRNSYNTSGSFGEALQNIIPSSSEIASAVWGYSGRTLSSFGSLIGDIWNYSARTLTSFGDLIAGIWNHSSRTLTSSDTNNITNNYTTNNYSTTNNTTNNTTNTNTIDTSNFATKTDVDNLKKEVLYNQTLLEKIVNKPIIENSLEEDTTSDIQTKLDQTQTDLATLFVNTYSLDSKLGLIDVKWKETDSKNLIEKIADLISINKVIEETSLKIKNTWNISLADSLAFQANGLKNRLNIIQNELNSNGKSRIVYDDIKSFILSLNNFINDLGSSKDKSGVKTLFGQIKKIKEQADTLDLAVSDIDKLLANWKSYQIADIQKRVKLMEENLEKINELPKTKIMFSSSKIVNENLENQLMNKVLSIKGTIIANKRLLARRSDKPFSASWLEIGSIVFKTLLTNPSERISQEVPLKYYLPSEVKKEDVISIDDGLKVNYDVEKKQLYVEGKFNLGPGESKIVSVRVEDIWTVDKELIYSLKKQAEELMRPLEKTTYFGQGVTIKSNIDVTLEKILNNLKTAVTPENKVKNYYEAQIEIKAVKDQIKNLEGLVAQAGSFGSMAGFVGGAQAIAVWGLIIIMVAGFVFLVLYMRALKQPETEEIKTKTKKKIKVKTPDIQNNMFRFAVFFFVLGAATSVTSGLIVYKAANYLGSKQVKKVKAKIEEKIISPVVENKSTGVKKEVLGVSEKVKTKIKINDLSGDFLRIRLAPEGKVIGKAYAGEVYTLIKEEENWVQIELQDGTGWVAKKFISVTD